MCKNFKLDELRQVCRSKDYTYRVPKLILRRDSSQRSRNQKGRRRDSYVDSKASRRCVRKQVVQIRSLTKAKLPIELPGSKKGLTQRNPFDLVGSCDRN